jgi:ketosteroid isomerase-like protein
MLPCKPADWPRLFEERLNGGDLDGVMALYDPSAHLVARSGEIIVGRDRIAAIISGMIRAKTQLQSQVRKTITVGDVAQLYTDFDGTALDNSGETVSVHYKAIEVLRRQPDGDWKLIVGNPNGRQ